MREFTVEDKAKLSELVDKCASLVNVVISGARFIGFLFMFAFAWFIGGLSDAIANTDFKEVEAIGKYFMIGFVVVFVAVGVIFFLDFLINLITYITMHKSFEGIVIDEDCDYSQFNDESMQSKLRVLDVLELMQGSVKSIPLLFLGVLFVVGGICLWKQDPSQPSFILCFFGLIPLGVMVKSTLVRIKEFKEKWEFNEYFGDDYE